MRKTSWSDIDKLKEAISSSTTYGQVMIKLGVKNHGGNYKTIKRKIKEFNIDTSHMLHQRHQLGNKKPDKHPLSYYLVKDCPVQIKTNTLKLRMIKEGLFIKECSSCKNSLWLDKPIPLELHHKNGDIFDNTIENLCLVCPNCHALTDNYRAKNRKKVPKKYSNCKYCNKQVAYKTSSCYLCHNKNRITKINWPSDQLLVHKYNTQTLLSISKELGISSNAIKKRVKKLVAHHGTSPCSDD